MVQQLAFSDCLLLDLLSLLEDFGAAVDVDVGRRQVGQALVVTVVVVLIDEGTDLPFQVAGQEVVWKARLQPEFAVDYRAENLFPFDH